MIEIIEFRDEFALDFASLNYAWIETYFSIEKHDREILDHPRKAVIETGGEVFFAMVDGRPLGTVAMIRSGDDSFELTKMAVSVDARRLGLGNRLMERCIEFAEGAGARKIWLESHTKLAPAIALYRKFGFVETPADPNSQYARADIRMELALPRPSM